MCLTVNGFLPSLPVREDQFVLFLDGKNGQGLSNPACPKATFQAISGKVNTSPLLAGDRLAASLRGGRFQTFGRRCLREAEI